MHLVMQSKELSTPRIMWSVVASLVPVIVASVYWYGPSAVLLLAAATAGCVLTERLFGPGGSLLADLLKPSPNS